MILPSSLTNQVGAEHVLGVKGVPLDDELTLASTLARLITIIIINIKIAISTNIMIMMMIWQVVHWQWGGRCRQQILPLTNGDHPSSSRSWWCGW